VNKGDGVGHLKGERSRLMFQWNGDWVTSASRHHHQDHQEEGFLHRHRQVSGDIHLQDAQDSLPHRLEEMISIHLRAEFKMSIHLRIVSENKTDIRPPKSKKPSIQRSRQKNLGSNKGQKNLQSIKRNLTKTQIRRMNR